MSLITCDLSLDELLEDDFYEYLTKWMEAPHVKFDNTKLSDFFSKEYLHRFSYYGDLGKNGEFFACKPMHYKHYKEIISDGTYIFPSIYCPWKMSIDKQTLLFSLNPFEVLFPSDCNIWLKYIIDNFFGPNGYFLNGNFVYSETGEYIVKNNKIMNF